MKEKIREVIDTLKNEIEEIEEISNGDWTLLAQTVGLQRAVDLLEEVLQ